ncbi:MAG: hypothetical protein M3R38_27605, partial [Actinomycetota bacterium]|nr:hypothetical protein [Actinomycetota bacterium]
MNANSPLDREDLLGIAKERFQFAKEMAPFVGANANTAPTSRSSRKGREAAGERRQTRQEPQIYDPLLDPLAEIAEKGLAAGVPVDPKSRGILEELLSRRQAQMQSAALNDPLAHRAEAFSSYLAKLATGDPKVKSFRQKVLRDSTAPSVEEAEAFLFSPATAMFHADWFEENGVPIIGH